MKWQEVRQHHPHRWVLVEATQAHIEAERWLADELAVVDIYEDVSKAMSRHKHLVPVHSPLGKRGAGGDFQSLKPPSHVQIPPNPPLIKGGTEPLQHLHRKDPARDFFVTHTDNTALSIANRSWIGVHGKQ